MPLFFFISGFFFKKRPFLISIKKDIHQLLIPWFFFAIVLFFTYLSLNLFGGYNLKDSIINTILKIDFLDEECWILYLSIWFLPCLFCVRVLYLFLFTYRLHILIPLLYLTGYFLQVNKFNIPFFLDTTFSVIFFYMVGHFYSSVKKELHPFAVFFMFLIYILLMTSLSPHVDLKYNVFPFYLFISPFLAIYPILKFSLYLSKACSFASNVLKNIGNSSLILLGLHRPIIEIGNIILLKTPIPERLHSFILFFTVVPIAYILGIYLTKKMPLLVGRHNARHQ